MERLEFEFPAKRAISQRAHVGVVGSNDLEVLLEPLEGDHAQVTVLTSVDGFRDHWSAVLQRFFSTYNGAARIQIHDAGATPGSVLLRLWQAVEVSEA
jgi:malonate decarboxylase delta subunit